LKTASKQALNASANPPPEGDFVWDGKDEDERPLSKDEIRAGIKNKGGRPKSTNPNKRSVYVFHLMFWNISELVEKAGRHALMKCYANMYQHTEQVIYNENW